MSNGSIPAHVPVIDGFRGIAALLVLVFHCWTETDPRLDGGALRALVAAGGLGVDFFFVISGFVLFLPVVRHGGRFGSVAAYAIRRAARIVPAYYLALVVQAAARPILRPGWPMPFETLGGLGVFLVHLLFLQHEAPRWLFRELGYRGAVMGFGVNGALWSLSIEVLFYAALPIAAGLYFRRPWLGLVGGVAAALAWRALAYRVGPVAETIGVASLTGQVPRLVGQFPGYLAHFAFGMSGAFVYGLAWQGAIARPRVGSRWLLLASLGVLVGAMVFQGSTPRGVPPGWYQRYLGDVVPALAFAVLMTVAAIRSGGLLARPLARWFGDVSYGVFLWHFPLLLFFKNALGWLPGVGDAVFLRSLLLVVPASLACGWLSRRFVEEPAIAWARRRSRPSPG